MADEPEEKADGEAAEPARETAVGHPVVEPETGKPDDGTTEVFFSRAEPEAAKAEDDASQPQPAAAPSTPPGGTSPAAADRQAAESHDQFQQKPELYIAGAFV